VTVPDAGDGLPHLPVAAHDHGGRFRARLARRVFAKADRTSPHHRIAERPGAEHLPSKFHPDVPGPDPGPGEHLAQLVWIQPGPLGESFEGRRVLLGEFLERGAHVVCEVGDIGPPRRGQAREVRVDCLAGSGRRVGDREDGHMAMIEISAPGSRGRSPNIRAA
jgi:hypothetical protein